MEFKVGINSQPLSRKMRKFKSTKINNTFNQIKVNCECHACDDAKRWKCKEKSTTARQRTHTNRNG